MSSSYPSRAITRPCINNGCAVPRTPNRAPAEEKAVLEYMTGDNEIELSHRKRPSSRDDVRNDDIAIDLRIMLAKSSIKRRSRYQKVRLRRNFEFTQQTADLNPSVGIGTHVGIFED